MLDIYHPTDVSVQWIIPRQVGDLFTCWKGRFGSTVMQAYRMPFLYASCGVFGESKIHVVSKIVGKQLQS